MFTYYLLVIVVLRWQMCSRKEMGLQSGEVESLLC